MIDFRLSHHSHRRRTRNHLLLRAGMIFLQIQLSASSRGIVDYFSCFMCDEYQWDCDLLFEERLATRRIDALEGSKLQCFAYDGQRRVLEIEFRVGAQHTPGMEIPLPAPPKIVQYFTAPRYVFTRL